MGLKINYLQKRTVDIQQFNNDVAKLATSFIYLITIQEYLIKCRRDHKKIHNIDCCVFYVYQGQVNPVKKGILLYKHNGEPVYNHQLELAGFIDRAVEIIKIQNRSMEVAL